jgi:hypothetical protein
MILVTVKMVQSPFSKLQLLIVWTCNKDLIYFVACDSPKMFCKSLCVYTVCVPLNVTYGCTCERKYL